MDIWDPDIISTREHLEQADDKIVFDRQRVMTYPAGAVDTVRKQENRALAAAGDKRLSGRRCCWLNFEADVLERRQDRCAILRRGELKAARAWASTESLRHFSSDKAMVGTRST